MKKNGFTLVELLLVVTLIGLVGLGMSQLLKGAVDQYSLTTSRKAMLAEARQGMERFVSEVRLIAAPSGMVTFTSTNFTFTTPASVTNISYTLNGSILERSGSSLVDNVSAMTFTYLDVNGNPTAVKESIWQIQIELTVTPPNAGSFNLKTRVFPRQFASGYAGFE